ncbi:hypothetical protein MGYG_06021 [Nannizzia gypsea CBS 118893]|uniref:Uncharacterized protein n=1 Tax=Arthroderma gypseum (strain ATCC MYA-4604 / CBS 118893) TaxID=535722 RepID=E4V084_ARTGP|nr:hypothetical protein MGYG_06021 [Nannizzia gypsea CBS 118893]EFR03021.1 hypothetical protein MGYG_06021 [Nannizzia gypsea CBS 118893]
MDNSDTEYSVQVRERTRRRMKKDRTAAWQPTATMQQQGLAGAPGTGRNGTKKNVAVSLGRVMVRSLISPIHPQIADQPLPPAASSRPSSRLSGESRALEVYNQVLAYITTEHQGPGRNAVQPCKEHCNAVDLIS